MDRDVIVVGGGIAGLSCGWRLARSGVDVLVLEGEPVAGGNVRSEVDSGFRMERGPHTFLASADDIFDLAEEVGVAAQIVQSRPAAARRFVARKGKLHAIPTGPWSFLTTPLLSARSKWTLATEPFRLERGSEGDTVSRFFERRFGPEAARVLAGAFVSGVYAGNPETLSAPAAFPLFWSFEKETGSMVRGFYRYMKRKKAARAALGDRAPKKRRGLYSLREGLGQLSAAVALRLGERCRTGASVEAIENNGAGFTVRTRDADLRAARLVVAVPPGEAARLLGRLDPELAEALAAVPMAPVAVTHFCFSERAAAVPDGFGFLVPRGEGIRSLGVLFPSRLFDGRAPEGGDLLAGFVGGMTDPGALDLDDESIGMILFGDLERLCGLGTRPVLRKVVRYQGAIPQLVLGHLDRMNLVRRRLARLPGLHLAGNYLHGVGMKDAVRSGFEAAEAVREGERG